MNAIFSHHETVRLEIEPFSLEANMLGPLGNKASSTLQMEVDANGFQLRTKKGGIHSRTEWHEFRELKNEVREKGRFSYFGTFEVWGNRQSSRIRIGLKGGQEQWEKLALAFDKLPDDVRGRTCPDCSGVVIDNVCRNCRKSFTSQQRKRGLRLLLIGAGVEALGITLTSAMYNESSGQMTVFVGLILIGLVLMVVGLVGLLFGVRT